MDEERGCHREAVTERLSQIGLILSLFLKILERVGRWSFAETKDKDGQGVEYRGELERRLTEWDLLQRSRWHDAAASCRLPYVPSTFAGGRSMEALRAHRDMLEKVSVCTPR